MRDEMSLSGENITVISRENLTTDNSEMLWQCRRDCSADIQDVYLNINQRDAL